MGFTHDIVVRITPVSTGSRIDLRSSSRYGRCRPHPCLSYSATRSHNQPRLKEQRSAKPAQGQSPRFCRACYGSGFAMAASPSLPMRMTRTSLSIGSFVRARAARTTSSQSGASPGECGAPAQCRSVDGYLNIGSICAGGVRVALRLVDLSAGPESMGGVRVASYPVDLSTGPVSTGGASVPPRLFALSARAVGTSLVRALRVVDFDPGTFRADDATSAALTGIALAENFSRRLCDASPVPVGEASRRAIVSGRGGAALSGYERPLKSGGLTSEPRSPAPELAIISSVECPNERKPPPKQTAMIAAATRPTERR